MRKLAFVLLLLAGACAPSRGTNDPHEIGVEGAAVTATRDWIPVGADDPTLGDAHAPVTVVIFGDYSCRHCGRASVLLRELEREYGASKLRVAWKHHPGDEESGVGAELGVGIQRLGGSDAYWAFHDSVYGEREEGETTRSRVVLGVAQLTTVTPLKTQDIATAAREHGPAKIKADMELASTLGVRALPTLFINGMRMEGAGEKAELASVIDAELALAERAIANGVAAAGVYAHRVAANRAAASSADASVAVDEAAHAAHAARAALEEESDEDTSSEPFDATVYKIPVGSSPVRGPATAPVTIVSFADFECRFCVKGAQTMRRLEKRYGDKLRFVFKHHPLPFHKRAEPAAQLALEIYARKGNGAFWLAHDALFDRNTDVGEASLLAIASSAGLDGAAAMKAVASRLHSAALEDDESAAEDGNATGTPTFFINGKRLAGAQKLGRFVKLIDQELGEAEMRIAAGVRPEALYDAVIASGTIAGIPAHVVLGAPSKSAPVRGPKTAPITVDVFSDFQCPFCKEHAKRLEQLELAFPGKLRLVFHNNPLASHADARAAAILALEAKRQLGDKGFWKMHDLLFYDDDAGLDRAGLEDKARAMKLDLAEVKKALDGTRFDKQLAADSELAAKLEARATPMTFINGYVVRGAQSVGRMKRVTRIALAEVEAKAEAKVQKAK